MNNIKMLMTGILMTEQLSSFNFLNLSITQLDKDMQNWMQNQSYQLIAEAKTASSKSTKLSHNLRIVPLLLKSKSPKSRITKIREVFPKKIEKSTNFNSSQDWKNEFSKRKTLTAKQRRNKLAFIQPKQGNFINRQNFIPEQNNNDIFGTSSQNFTTQRLPNISFSSSGVAVKVLQSLLVANGYTVNVDGYFGPLTETAIKAFQEQHNLKVDGIVGTQTWSCLTIYSKYQSCCS